MAELALKRQITEGYFQVYDYYYIENNDLLMILGFFQILFVHDSKLHQLFLRIVPLVQSIK